MDDRWLAATIERPDGTALTFGPHEDDLGRVLAGTEFQTQTPGGFAEGSLKIARPDGLDSTDIPLFASVRIYGPGNQTAYEGRVAAKPRFGVDEISVELEGWSAHLDDDETARENYVVPELDLWQGPSVQRKIVRIDAGDEIVGDPGVESDESEPALVLNAPAGLGSGNRERVEAWFDSGMVGGIGDVFFGWLLKDDGLTTGQFSLTVYTATSATDATGASNSGDLFGTLSGSDFLSDLTTVVPARWASIRWLQTADFTTPRDRKAIMAPVVVYGSHGLPTFESDSFAWEGVLGSDVVKHAVRKWAPMLNVLDTDIEPSAFVIPALSFRELPNTPRNIVEAVTLLGGAQQVPNDWGVYEGRRFFWRSAGSYGRTWEIRKDEGAKPEDEGEDAAQRANGLMVSFQDTAGTTFTVGPPDSGADFESDDLADTDPQNPVNLAGIPRRWRARDGGTSFEDGATILGRLSLSEANRDGRRGSYSIPGLIDGEPPWLLRAGDRVREQDEPAATEEPVISTTYTHDESYAVQASIGLPPNRLDVILAQLAAVGG